MSSLKAKIAAVQELHDTDRLTADELVTVAADPKHPCHNDFEWDDSVAAHKHRLHQARSLIGTLRVHITGGGTVEVETRMYLRPPSSDRYLNGDDAVANFRDELVQQCFRQVRSTVVKFRRLGDDELRAQFDRALTAD